MNLKKYDEKIVRIIDIDNNEFDGLCSYNSEEYNEIEYGKTEESLQIMCINFYKPFIKNVEILENGFIDKYGNLESLIVDSGVEFIEEVFESDDIEHINRLVDYLKDNKSLIDNKILNSLKELISRNINNDINNKIQDLIKNVIDSADIDSALTHSSKLDEFVSLYLKDYIDPVITVLEVKNYDHDGTSLKNNETTYPKTKIVLDYVATTYKGKLENYLNKDETIGYNFIRDSVDQMIIPIKCDKKNYASISIMNSKTKVKVDKNYIITINIENKGALNEYNCANKINKNKLEKDTNKMIKRYINKTLKKQDKSKGEFLGLKRYIYLEYPKYKNEEYKVKLNINTKITRTGEINKSSKGEKNENK